MSKAINQSDDKRRNEARKFASQMLEIIKDYIPSKLHRDAWEQLAALSYDNELELTTAAMRREYEAWKSTMIENMPNMPVIK